MLVTFCRFSFVYPSMTGFSNLVYGRFSRNRGPPLETLLTRFRKLQPSPLEVGDHLISRGRF